ncbi:hypothetical protein ZOSMA_389G00050 [Zostera marina]|uniref:HMG box domain-containing protein n=1 Tax=Zostera marina TaxID=29655 RepID=A0A0K9P734_ZOSMR|nr:hypothetical protein ZOSMA_389G00050 [Zostera marina]
MDSQSQLGEDERRSMDATLTRDHNRRELKIKRSTKPKKNRSGYTLYLMNQFPKMKAAKFGSRTEICMHVGYQWRHLSPFKKSVYQKMAAKDKERYEKEMKINNDQQKSVQEGKKEHKGVSSDQKKKKNIRVPAASKHTLKSFRDSINENASRNRFSPPIVTGSSFHLQAYLNWIHEFFKEYG